MLYLQVLFDRDAGDLGVTPEMFNTLKKFNTARFEILEQLLTTLGLECNPQSSPKFTPAVLVTKNQVLYFEKKPQKICIISSPMNLRRKKIARLILFSLDLSPQIIMNYEAVISCECETL